MDALVSLPRRRSPSLIRLTLGLVALLAGCGTPAPMMMTTPPAEALSLPAGFLYGTAIAGFQVEAGCPTVDPAECEDRHDDWYHYVSTPSLIHEQGLYLSGDPVSWGPGFYELYAQDIERAHTELSNNSLRLSIEWSRLFPSPTFGIRGHEALRAIADPKALAYYHNVFAELKKRGMTPLVTIHHYTLPDWMDDAVGCHADLSTCAAKGWADDRIVDEIATYAGFLGAEFGGEVDLWATLNEPVTAVVLAGFVFQTAQRTNPPAVSLAVDAAKKALDAMITAHAAMYKAVHASDTVDADGDGVATQVGTVYNLQAVQPSDPNEPLDVTGARNLDYIMNRVFLDAIAKGKADLDLSGTQVDRPDLQGLDFLGINYYATLLVQGTPTSVLPKLSPLLTANVLTLGYDWARPEGIHDVMKFAGGYGIPLYITETGTTDPDDQGPGSAWVVRTLGWSSRAITEGIPLRGYFYWTLMDNYEWNHGMEMRFGMYAVDKGDPKKLRTLRGFGRTYAGIAAAGKVSAELLAKYPL